GFGHDGNVDDVAALAADILAKPDPQQSGFGGLAVEPARHLSDLFPFAQVWHDFIAHERRCRVGQRAALGGIPDIHARPRFADSSSPGISAYRARSHSPRALACGSKRVEAATPSPRRPEI